MTFLTKKKAFEHQDLALSWAGSQHRVIFFMEMRLGKTLVAIRWLHQFSLQKILVVAPKPVLSTWQEELACEGVSSTILRGTSAQVRFLLDLHMSHWYITNFEALYTYPGERGKNQKPILSIIALEHWDAVIVDESTNIRNPQAVRTKICKRAFKNVEFKSDLSGLPNPESYLDFFEQFAHVFGEFAGCRNFWQFRFKYFNQYGYEWVLKPGARQQLKQIMANQAFFLQRADVRDIIEKVYEKRTVELPDYVREAYNLLEADWAYGDMSTKHRIVVDVWLNRLAAGSSVDPKFVSQHKLEELLTLLTTELEFKQVVVWAIYNNQIDSIVAYLEKAGISARSMTGESTSATQDIARVDFRKGKFQVLVCQIKLGKYGLDFSQATAAIYMSNSWELELRAQSEDRVINPNKKSPSLIVDILTEDTIEEDVYRALRKKEKNAKNFNAEVTSFTLDRLRRKRYDETGRIATNETRREKTRAYLRKIGVLS